MTEPESRIIAFITSRPGLSALEIAQGIYGERANANAVHKVLLGLLDAGRLTREGSGWKNSPFRYRVAAPRDSFDVMGRGQPYGP